MAENRSNQTILFADITGSTSLYESLGDEAARKLCADSINLLTAIIGANHGRVVKTMGDGIMAAFPSVLHGYDASVSMQEAHDNKQLAITIGFHDGQVIEENGDLFGDTVNLAAKIAAKAKPGEVLLTEQAADKLPGIYRMTTRFLDCVRVKGKNDPVNIHTILYDHTEATIYASSVFRSSVTTKPDVLIITCGDSSFTLPSTNSKGFQLGRDGDNDLVSKSPFASRNHAVIEFQRDRFVITDQSTNGTFVSSNGENTFQLKRESAPLPGDGIISLGEKPLGNNPTVFSNPFFIHYSNK